MEITNTRLRGNIASMDSKLFELTTVILNNISNGMPLKTLEHNVAFYSKITLIESYYSDSFDFLSLKTPNGEMLDIEVFDNNAIITIK